MQNRSQTQRSGLTSYDTKPDNLGKDAAPLGESGAAKHRHAD